MEFETREERNKYIMDNMGLVSYVVNDKIKFYNKKDYDYRDIISLGSIGLIKAVNEFDESKNVDFPYYAVCKIYGEITNDFKTVRNGIRYSVKTLRNKKAVSKMKDRTDEEISKELNLKIEEVWDIKCLNNAEEIYSLEHPFTARNKKDAVLLHEVLANKNDFTTKIEIRDLLEKLSKRDKKIIDMYILQNYSVDEVCKEFDISRSHFFRLVKQSLNKLRQII